MVSRPQKCTTELKKNRSLEIQATPEIAIYKTDGIWDWTLLMYICDNYILFVYTGGLLRSEFSASAEGDGWAYGAAIEMHESASGWWIKGTSKWLLLSE